MIALVVRTLDSTIIEGQLSLCLFLVSLFAPVAAIMGLAPTFTEASGRSYD
jgi:hypothetical protein